MHTLQHSFVNQLLAHTAAGGDFVGLGQVGSGGRGTAGAAEMGGAGEEAGHK